MEHVEEAGVHSGDSACVIPPPTLSAEVDGGHRGPHPGHRRRPRRPGPAQRAVRGQAGPGVRHRGQPPGQPHGAVRGQGHRRAPGQGGGPGHGRARRWPSCGPRACCGRRSPAATWRSRRRCCPSTASPTSTPCSGPEMRSTGEVMGIDRTFGLAFAKSQIGGRRPAARRRAPCSCRWPTGTRRAACERGPPVRRARLRHRGHAGTAALPGARRGARWPTVVAKVGEAADGRRRRPASPTARSTWWSTPPGAVGRGPTAPTSAPRPASTSVPCLTTVAAALAAANGMADWAVHGSPSGRCRSTTPGGDLREPRAAVIRPHGSRRSTWPPGRVGACCPTR